MAQKLLLDNPVSEDHFEIEGEFPRHNQKLTEKNSVQFRINSVIHNFKYFLL